MILININRDKLLNFKVKKLLLLGTFRPKNRSEYELLLKNVAKIARANNMCVEVDVVLPNLDDGAFKFKITTDFNVDEY